MKKHTYITAGAFMLLASFLGTACTDGNDWNTDKSYDRLFSVTSANLSISAKSTSAEITWNAIPEAEYYIMEYSTDSLYDDIEMGGTSHSVVLGEDKSIVESPYTITGLQGETKYFFRMKSMSDHKKESRWTYMDDYAFETPGEQIFNSVATADLTENTIRLTWLAEAEVTHVDIYASEEAFEAGEAVLQTYEITADDLAVAACTISGLEAQTEYWFVIYNGETKRGEIGASTTAPMPDADLKISLEEGITLIDQVLIDDLAAQAQAAAGGASDYSLTLGIPGGATIDVHGVDEETGEAAGLAIPEGLSVTFFALPGERPTLNLPKSLEIGGTHGYIRFDGLTIVDGGCQYFINEGNGATIGDFTLTNCMIDNMSRSIVRLQASDAVTFNDITIDNCVVTNIGSGGYAVFRVDNAAYTIGAINVTNSTFSNVGHNFIQAGKCALAEVNISGVTFYNAPNNASRYLVDANGNNTNVNVENTLFGLTPGRGIRTDGTITVTNSFKTTDGVFSSNDFDVDVTSPEAASAEVFTDPENGDFTLLIDDLNGIGDPRWYTE